MLNIDQVKLLEDKVEKAVELIETLYDSNVSLKKELEERDKRIEELEKLILVFKDDQTKIEQGIINALTKLSAFEASVSQYKEEAVPKYKKAEFTTTKTEAEQNVVQSESSIFSESDDNSDTEKSSSENYETKDDVDGNVTTMQNDLDYVLGESSEEEKKSENIEDAETSQQLDIF